MEMPKFNFFFVSDGKPSVLSIGLRPQPNKGAAPWTRLITMPVTRFARFDKNIERDKISLRVYIILLNLNGVNYGHQGPIVLF